jgi:hypothetical protein
VAATVCNTQDRTAFASNFDTAKTIIKHNNTNASDKSTTPKASGRTHSLFGSVMRQVQQHDKFASTPSKQANQHQQQQQQQLPLSGKTPERKISAFTPEKRSALPFGSPGGFQLLDFVNNCVASPFSPYGQSCASNMSTKSSAPPPEWNNTDISNGVVNWSLPKSLRFDCHPGPIINPLLQQNDKGLGLMRFLQSSSSSTIGSSNYNSLNEKDLGLAHWGSGLLFWQHPAIYPSPFVDTNKPANVPPTTTLSSKEDSLQLPPKMKKRRASLDLSAAHPLSEVGNYASRVNSAHQFNKNNKKLSYALKQQRDFQTQRRQEWQQAFASLYWKWISYLKQQQQDNDIQTSNAYFYASGQDHVVLFLAGSNDVDKSVAPKIIVSSSSAAFRKRLRQSGVQELRLLQAWNGHAKDAVFHEYMIEQPPPPPPPKPTKTQQMKSIESKSSTDDISASKDDDNQHVSSIPTAAATPTKGGDNCKTTTAAKTPSKDSPAKDVGAATPASESSSPKVEAELAALRRSQVFGEKVGADVKVSIKNKASKSPKLSLKSIPPLYLTGWDDCAAFFEVYLNLGSSCVAPYPSASAASFGDKNGSKNKGKPTAPPEDQTWQLPDDVPLLTCRSVGPFQHATMKTLTVRGNRQYPTKKNRPGNDSSQHEYSFLEIQGGPILPCAVMGLINGLVHTMNADRESNPNKKSMSPLKHVAGDEGNVDDETMVGSHNLILRVFPPDPEEQNEENESKNGIIGSSGSQHFNHGVAEKGGNQDVEDEGNMEPKVRSIESGNELSMAVWDILHPTAMAYKVEPAVSFASTSALSSLQ